MSVSSLQLPPSFSDADIGAPGLSGSAVFNPAVGTWTVNGGGSDIWNGSDQFNYASELFDGDGTLVAQVEGMNYTDPWAKAGVMFRDSLDAGAVFADAVVTPGNGVAFQWRDQYGNLGNEQVYGLAAPVWVELVRQGDEFTGYYSTDGVDWYAIGAPVTLDMDTDALAGLAVTAHNDGLLNSATFTNVSALPAGWGDQDIGSPGLPGGATFDGTTWTVLGGGSDIWNGADQFNFASQGSPGIVAIAADLDSLTDTDPWAKAGVMFRESDDPGSVFADMVVTPGEGVTFQWRDQYGNLGNDQVLGISAPVEVKLVRSGDDFTGYYSADGVTWVEVGSQSIEMGTSALAGLAVTAHNDGLLNEATFTGVELAYAPVPTSITLTGPSVRNQPISSVEVAFTLPIDPSTLPGSLSLTLDGATVEIPAGTLTVSLVPGTTATYLVSGLASLTVPEGDYVITVDGSQVLDVHDLAPGEGTASASWLMDTTPPTSRVQTLPTRESSLSFPVTVTGTDPQAADGGPASGIASFTIYVSTNGGPWQIWTTVAPTSISHGRASATATFTGQDHMRYAFYSIATDAVGNAQAYHPSIETITVVLILPGGYDVPANAQTQDSGDRASIVGNVPVSIGGSAPVAIGAGFVANEPDGRVAGAIGQAVGDRKGGEAPERIGLADDLGRVMQPVPAALKERLWAIDDVIGSLSDPEDPGSRTGKARRPSVSLS